MRKGLQELLLRVFWQFLSPEAQSKWKPAITNCRYCWELTELPRTGQLQGPYAQIVGLWHAMLCSVAGTIVQGWCLLPTHTGRQALFIPSMIQEGLECAGCSRGILQREMQEQLSLKRIVGLCPYCVCWNGRSEGDCLNLQHVVYSKKGGSFSCLQTLSWPTSLISNKQMSHLQKQSMLACCLL